MLVALFGVSLVAFVVTRVLPGNPAYMIVGVLADESTVAAVIERLGLDLPVHEQYFRYIRQILAGDLGDNWRIRNPVVVDIGARWPATIELGSVALILAIAWSVPFGIVSALRRRSISDRLANAVSGPGVSIPEVLAGPDPSPGVLRNPGVGAGPARADAGRHPTPHDRFVHRRRCAGG